MSGSGGTATITSSKAAKALAELQERRAEIERQRDERTAELEAARDEVGHAVALGDDPADLAATARALAEDVAGLDRALPLLAAEIEATGEALREAERDEAEAEARRRLKAAEKAIEALDGALRIFVEEVTPLVERAAAESRRAAEAEKAARHHAGGGPVTSRTERLWSAFPGLRQRLAALDLDPFAAEERVPA